MSDPATRNWRLYVEDMIGFAEKVLLYTDGLDRQSFALNDLNRDATLRNLELIGEAASRVPGSVRVAHPEIPWRQIVATRNRLIHAYLGLDDDTLWSIVETDIPKLLANLRAFPPDDE